MIYILLTFKSDDGNWYNYSLFTCLYSLTLCSCYLCYFFLWGILNLLYNRTWKKICAQSWLNLQEETSAMRNEVHDLRTNARIFQLSKCTACTFTLDLPAVHFMCMHSFHQRCLGDNEKECPECAPEYRVVLDMKRSLEQNSKNQDRFFQQVRTSKDGFSVIADYFGKGIISKTSTEPSDALQTTNGNFWKWSKSISFLVLLSWCFFFLKEMLINNFCLFSFGRID